MSRKDGNRGRPYKATATPTITRIKRLYKQSEMSEVPCGHPNIDKNARSQGRDPSEGTTQEEWGAYCTKNNRQPKKPQHPDFQRHDIATYQHRSDKEQNVRQRGTRPIKSPEHHEREQRTTHGGQPIRVPPTQSSRRVPTPTISDSDSGTKSRGGIRTIVRPPRKLQRAFQALERQGPQRCRPAELLPVSEGVSQESCRPLP